ncbi:ClC family H(+)/Cl(-) exchange transporter [Streptomyces sp. NBC_01264]|uniref:ClC family H(+)/Cl(-) exchange transporter n=1 Tax=Streptomyces sp. NBC_01264 TaxID=2903804 RepID=UPI0022573E81|nr:ClC family H(+)/Cl(-) exchange transporter [Streptomyces sp. NBC_01264]MCX4784473.1 ClC family H(+)/Cl(-) exchange transporter [Streptomyces sp. NBC_01264]
MPGGRTGAEESGHAFAVAALAGCLVGLVGGGFRWCLEHADRLRGSLLDVSTVLGPAAWLLPVLLTAVGATVACWIGLRVPHSAGSGIPHVQTVWRKETEPHVRWLVTAKFTGGLIAIGSGLVLGREGPIVHMGATIGSWAGRWSRVCGEDARLLHAALGGAGLAAAFSAPLGGLVFICEEVTHSVRPRMVLLTLVSTVTAVVCAQAIVGDEPVFGVPPLSAPPLWSLPVFLVFGVTAGVLGAGYGALVVGTFRVCNERLGRVPVLARAAGIGAVVGGLMAFEPLLAGGGDPLSEWLSEGRSITVAGLVVFLAVRFAAGPLSYAAATPGGLFAPLLALGALWGALVHELLSPLLSDGSMGPSVFAVVGMAALFTGVVRAPLTGIVLLVEMTGSATLLIPLMTACFAASLTADRLGSEPVYESLRRRMGERL